MEIVCPQCLSKFHVPDGMIGSQGRKVKCSQCGHIWKYVPVSEHQNVATPRESLPETVEMSATVSDSRNPASLFRNDLSADDFNSGKKQESQENHTVFPRNNNRIIKDQSSLHDIEIEDFLNSDPEPIPQILSRGENVFFHKTSKKSGRGIFSVLMIVLAFFVLLASGAYFGRNYIVIKFPGLEKYYEMTGIKFDYLGRGLKFEGTSAEYIVQDGANSLMVMGFIDNVLQSEVDMPFLKLSLFDATGALVQAIVSEPPVPSLKPNEKARFRIVVKNPSAAARRFEIYWAQSPLLEDKKTRERSVSEVPSSPASDSAHSLDSGSQTKMPQNPAPGTEGVAEPSSESQTVQPH